MKRMVRLSTLSVVSALLVLSALVAGNRMNCAPIPVEPACVGAGENVFPWDPTGPECCEGLAPTVISEVDPETGACTSVDGAMVCLACGDGVCDALENSCNCPEDCTEDCAGPGEYVFPWDPTLPGCCPGLESSSVFEIDADGQCQPLLGGAVCIRCGDGVCGPGEDVCSCPDDCTGGCEGLGEEACVARAGCEPGYHGFCDCTCPGPPGYEGGGCDACGADCFAFAACVSAPVDLDLDLDTTGGYTGAGGRDYHLHDGYLRVHDPFGQPEECTVELTDTQMARLLRAAGHVDWAALLPTYISPDNPFCCCDQFVYAFESVVRQGDGTSVSVRTEWCDESLFGGLLPPAFRTFYEELQSVGGEVAAFCQPID